MQYGFLGKKVTKPTSTPQKKYCLKNCVQNQKDITIFKTAIRNTTLKSTSL